MNALATTWPRQVTPRRSFASVAKERLDDVFRYLLFLTGDPSLAEDLAAATFEQAFRSWRRFDPRRGSERSWLFGLARSTALDHFRAESRRRRREERYYASDTASAAEPELAGFSPELDAALRTLAAGEREVIALRIVLDLDAQAAARVLGISRSACSMRLARALQKLEERLEIHALA